MENITSRRFKAANVIQLALVDILRTKAKTLDIRFCSLNITLTKVVMTGDLRIAKCFFVPTFGLNKLNLEETIKTLQDNSRNIRTLVTSKIQLKYSPEIQFFYDESFEIMQKMDSLLNSI
jgi:ribosome-binding factor A